MEENIEFYVLLHDGYPVPKDILDSAQEAVEEVIPAMFPGYGYTAKLMCGYRWDQWSDGERRLVGRCLSSLVKTGKLPLAALGCPHQYPRRYEVRKPQS